MSLTISQRELRLLGTSKTPIDLEAIPGKRSLRARSTIPPSYSYEENQKKKSLLQKAPCPASYSPQIAWGKAETAANRWSSSHFNPRLNSFTVFGKLPEKLRKRIWQEAVLPRTITVSYDTRTKTFFSKDGRHPLLKTSKEAYYAALEVLIPVFTTPVDSAPIYIRAEKDIIFLDPGRCGDPGLILADWHAALRVEEFRKVERLDIGIYEDRTDLMSCAETLQNTFFLDQAMRGLRLTQVRFVSHLTFACTQERYGRDVHMLNFIDDYKVKWEDDKVDKVNEVNAKTLGIARGYWGCDWNETYEEGVNGPVEIETHQMFCRHYGMEK